MQVVDECRLADSQSQPGNPGLFSPSHKPESLLHVATVGDDENFNFKEIDGRNNSLSLMQESLDNNKQTMIADFRSNGQKRNMFLSTDGKTNSVLDSSQNRIVTATEPNSPT